MKPRVSVSAMLLSALAACANVPSTGGRSQRVETAIAVPPLGIGSESPATPAPPAPPIGRALEPVAAFDEPGSRVVLAKIAEARVAFVADEDDRAIHTVDLERRVDLARTPLAGAPAEMAIAADGRLYVALRGGAAIAKLAAGDAPDAPLVVEATLDTSPEPVGLALAKDGRTLYAVTGVSHSLEAFAVGSGERLFARDLPREPRAVLIHGDRAFVAHLAGSGMTVVDLAAPAGKLERIELAGELAPEDDYECGTDNQRKPNYTTGWMPAAQGESLVEIDGTVFAPQTIAWTKDGDARSLGYGPFGVTEIGVVAAIDADKRALYHESVSVVGVRNERCLLPRAAARRPSKKTILVACLGADRIQEVEPVRHMSTEVGSWKVASGPTGIAVDGERDQAVVFSQFDRAVSILDLGARHDERWGQQPASPPSFDLAPLAQPLDPLHVAGRKLFHATNNPAISADGRACASCHPEGRDDGLVWSSPGGLRQTPSLAGRLAGTAPYDWEGDHDDLDVHIASTVKDRLHGKGLARADASALAAYVASLPPPPTSQRAHTEAEARGEALFRSDRTACARCHDGPVFTDNRRHDVGSGGRFETPSLSMLGSTAPYYHDGRYKTLGDLLRAPGDPMGHTSELDDQERADLEAYLSSL